MVLSRVYFYYRDRVRLTGLAVHHTLPSTESASWDGPTEGLRTGQDSQGDLHVLSGRCDLYPLPCGIIGAFLF